jgi:hypothetical protein
MDDDASCAGCHNSIPSGMHRSVANNSQFSILNSQLRQGYFVVETQNFASLRVLRRVVTTAFRQECIAR